MTMVGQEEVVLCKDQLHIIKEKRPRPVSPAMSSSTGGESRRSNDDSREFDGASGSNSTTSVEVEPEAAEEDEENMAYCLMLLSQGPTRKQYEPAPSYVHRCRTCNRCFPSFQALGGHRAGHKKPKDYYMNKALSLRVTSKAVVSSYGGKSRVHECSICGAEFSSGQALGGHMRRHRTPTTTTITTSSSPGTEDLSSKKPRTILQFDLNFPAPEDDHPKEPSFKFASKEKLVVFSASSLVDCHY